MKTTITSEEIYHSIIAASIEVMGIEKKLNEINVFPVSDGDTGTNLTSTMRSIVLKSKPFGTVYQTLNSISRSALEGARGNSGVIMAEFISSLNATKVEAPEVTTTQFSEICIGAYEATYSSLSQPMEGTILSVMKTWSHTFRDALHMKGELIDALAHALKHSELALQETKNQMQVLKDNDVVDSGAMGFVAFVRGIYNYFSGNVKMLEINKIGEEEITEEDETHAHILVPGEIRYGYCFEILFEMNGDFTFSEESFKSFGDSLVVAKAGSYIKMHIHTNDPDLVIDHLPNETVILEQKIDDMIVQSQLVHSPRGRVAVVTDSNADLPLDFVKNHNITVIPMMINIGSREYYDRLTLDTQRFYDVADRSLDFPKTAMPKAMDVEKYLKFVTKHYDEVLILCVSDKLSGTYQLFRKILVENDYFDKKIQLIDTKKNSIAQGLLVKEAVEMLEQGISLEDVSKKIMDLIEQTKIYVSVSDFNYMIRGGRVKPLKGLLGKLFNLKPIISLDSDGRGVAFGASFSQKKAMDKLIKIVSENKKSGNLDLAIAYTDDLDLADVLEKKIKRKLGLSPLYTTSVSSVVGTSAGRSTVAVAFIKREGE